jgi:molybdopterin/thiamine biosynthesis adenylyltransferase
MFGREGQDKLRASTAAVVGANGTGSPTIQQLAFLGVGKLFIIDDGPLKESGRNRNVSSRHYDPIPGSMKVDLAKRMVEEIDPEIQTVAIPYNLLSPEAFEAIKKSEYAFGCVDNDGARFVLNELCMAYEKNYFDLATDTPDHGYGGRVCISWNGEGCIYCLLQLDALDVAEFLATGEELERHQEIYGVRRELLDEAGPSVITINSVVASLAVTEFMAAVTGMRPPAKLLTYYGHDSVVRKSLDLPRPDCPYCAGIRGQKDLADMDRYLLRRIKGKKVA